MPFRTPYARGTARRATPDGRADCARPRQTIRQTFPGYHSVQNAATATNGRMLSPWSTRSDAARHACTDGVPAVVDSIRPHGSRGSARGKREGAPDSSRPRQTSAAAVCGARRSLSLTRAPLLHDRPLAQGDVLLTSTVSTRAGGAVPDLAQDKVRPRRAHDLRGPGDRAVRRFPGRDGAHPDALKSLLASMGVTPTSPEFTFQYPASSVMAITSARLPRAPGTAPA